MATVAHGFTHLDLTCRKGDELPDDHPLVALAPHLFEQPPAVKTRRPRHVRIRGPLVEPTPKADTAAAPGADPQQIIDTIKRHTRIGGPLVKPAPDDDKK